MQRRNGQPARLRSSPGHAAVHAGSSQDQQVSGHGDRRPDAPATNHEPPAGADRADVAAGGRLIMPFPAGLGQPRRRQPGLAEPPDRPRPPEPRDGPPPVPGALPKRRPDPSRPSVPSRFATRPEPAGGTRPVAPP